jgi:hypothetical protein
MWSDKFVGYTRIEIFFNKASFFSFFITTHIVYLLFVYPETYFLFTSNFQNILFVYLVTALFYCYITYVSC